LTAADLIRQLALTKHPEGGWYRETYRSDETIKADALPDRFTGKRSFSTAIYFLLQSGDISALHRIKSDEIWHYHSGVPLTVHVITPQGRYLPSFLGSDIASGDSFQCVVPAGSWFGAEVSGEGYSIVGCTVSPGFDFSDFEMGNRETLMQQFPEQAEIILRLTKSAHLEGQD
jgi:predicted cupin superfamily sugar epimerase